MSKSINLSAFIVTKNEEKILEECLKNLDFCDEIIVIDQHSTDKTTEIAKKYTKRVFIDKDYQYCEPSRGFGEKKCSGKWIFNLDADETATPALKKEILKAIKSNKFDVYRIHRDMYFMGKLMKHAGAQDYVYRLHKKDAIKYIGEVHNGVIVPKKAKVATLKYSIKHANISFQRRIQRSRTVALLQSRVDPKYNKFPRKYFGIFLTPIFYFFHQYLMKKSIFDGKEGFILACLAFYYEFLVYKNVLLHK